MEYVWNPWHGCRKVSEGCKYCYMYRRDESVGRSPEEVYKTKSFEDPLRKKRGGGYKFEPGSRVIVCLTSDFFLEEADAWRSDIWQMIKLRGDLDFFIITKRILRFNECIPEDWGEGYDNVTVACTVENQRQADIRLPVFREIKIKNKQIICEPLLGAIDLEEYMDFISGVTAGGESGPEARVCDYRWVLDIRDRCARHGVPFWFKQTGAHFIKDGRLYNIRRKFQHSQARQAGIDIRRWEIMNETEKDNDSF